jgi:hypothetical protein
MSDNLEDEMTEEELLEGLRAYVQAYLTVLAEHTDDVVPRTPAFDKLKEDHPGADGGIDWPV